MGARPQIEMLDADSLIPYANNTRTHSEDHVVQIASSIKEFGFTNPILVDADNGIIAGHGRVLAARKLDIAQVPCIRLGHLDERQRRAYIIADNKLALNAGWDDELLALELGALDEDGFDLSLTGFNKDELSALMLPDVVEGQTDEDAVPESNERTKTVSGDVWILGKHRVICGDAKNVDDWDRLEIEPGAVVFTSPPYNLGEAIKFRSIDSIKKNKSAYETYEDNASDREYVDLISGALINGMAHCDVVALNLQPLAKSKRPLMQLLSDYATHLIDIVTWDKGTAAPHIKPGVMASRYEWLLLYSSKENASRSIPYADWQGKFSNVYQAPRQTSNEFSDVHGATFPVHFPEYVIGDLMNRCKSVVDCFCGTGTTIIAAEKLSKVGYGIEIDPKYCDIIVNRWQDYTGQKAVHAETGEPFDGR